MDDRIIFRCECINYPGEYMDLHVAEPFSDDGAELSFAITPTFNTLIPRLRLAWNILRGREHWFGDVILSQRNLERLEAFLENYLEAKHYAKVQEEPNPDDGEEGEEWPNPDDDDVDEGTLEVGDMFIELEGRNAAGGWTTSLDDSAHYDLTTPRMTMYSPEFRMRLTTPEGVQYFINGEEVTPEEYLQPFIEKPLTLTEVLGRESVMLPKEDKQGLPYAVWDDGGWFKRLQSPNETHWTIKGHKYLQEDYWRLHGEFMRRD